MYAARNKNGSLHLFESHPYLHINAHKKIVVGRDEIGHDVFVDVYGEGPEIFDAFWSEYRSLDEWLDYDNGIEINSKLFPEVTFEKGVYNLKTMKFEKKKLQKSSTLEKIIKCPFIYSVSDRNTIY